MILNIFKWGIFAILVFINVAQTFFYIRIRKYFEKLPLIAAQITCSELLNYTGERGRRVWEARIRYKYSFRGKEYEGSTPALRSPQLFGPAWEFESKLVEECKVGDFVNVRVVPAAPELAYIKVAPFSFWSAVLLPVITVLYAGFIIVYFWFLGSNVNEIIDQW
jgi:hypothetical protein